VRDALLHWPVAEERAEAECRRDLVSHRVWVRRWLLQYPGDGALAARKILAHLRWRREYRLDTIMDEVRCTCCSDMTGRGWTRKEEGLGLGASPIPRGDSDAGSGPGSLRVLRHCNHGHLVCRGAGRLASGFRWRSLMQ
jgi:hypothetical protein